MSTMTFDYQRAAGLARTQWTKGKVKDENGNLCAVGIMAVAAGVELTRDNHDNTMRVVDELKFLGHGEVFTKLINVIKEQEPQVFSGPQAVVYENAHAEAVVWWNDSRCDGGPTLASYFEKLAADQ